MDSEPRTQWADTQGVHYGDAGRASDEIATDSYETRDASQVLRAPDRSGNASAAHEAAANSVIRRALLIEPATGGRDGKIDFDVDPVRGINPKERVVPRRPVPAGGKRSSATPVAGPRMARRANSCLPIAWVPAVSEPELLLPDVPLIVEDLLLQARQLADAGAPTEAVKAILDHVAALREGRG